VFACCHGGSEMPSLRELEPAVWSELEFGACKLGDKRRTRRLVRYARQMAEKPDASTPRQTEDWGDCKAVYRMFESELVTFEAVTATHYERCRNLEAGRYLVISDTTELDYGYKSRRKGLGRLGAKNHRGFFLHSALIVCADQGQVVGMGAQELFTRGLTKLRRVHRQACRKRATEADVWGRVMERVQPVAAGVQLIHVCDRGADNFDVFAHLHVKGDSWVIRAAQLTRKVRHKEAVVKLSAVLDAAPVLGTYEVYIAANGKQQARWAKVEVRATQVTLLRPREGSTTFVIDRNIREIATWIVEVREVHPPKNGLAVRWVLYTGEAAATFDEALDVVKYYERRPLIEEYHKCLKTGLRVEKRQYEDADRLEPVIGVICVQAVRLLQLRDVSRHSPATPAKGLVPPEWLEVIAKVLTRPRPLQTVREFLRAVASLGGFLCRKSDGEPGWQTIWLGLETLLVALRGYRAGLRGCG
jgi:hypothetical protein